MMESNAIRWIYGLLFATCLAVSIWQYSAHEAARQSLRDELHDRSEDISRAIALVIRAEGRFDAVPQDRVDAVLDELTASTNLRSVSLLDVKGKVIAQSGQGFSQWVDIFSEEQAFWGADSAVFVNLVALGELQPDFGAHGPDGGPPEFGPRPDNFRGPPPEWPGGDEWFREQRGIPPEKMAAFAPFMDGTPLTMEEVEEVFALLPIEGTTEETRGALVVALLGQILTPETLDRAHFLLRHEFPGRLRRGGPGPRWHGMGPDDLLDKRGIHAFVVEVPASEVYLAESRDFQMRLFLVCSVWAVGLVMYFLFQTLRRSAKLGVQLARSEAITTHLHELNVAAAGLVHETKNPLNVIRGLAQMLEREAPSTSEKQGPALRIMEEADRVAGRLNQFLDYSRPLTPKLTRVAIRPLVDDLFAVLDHDREEKNITFDFQVAGPDTIRADGDMLRQVLFNLLINAIEAVALNGHIHISTGRVSGGKAWIEVQDDGPGVDPVLLDTLFQPYVTGTESGTGLGLTVVRQIVLAHNWTVICEDRPSGGSTFRITGITVE